MYVHIIQNLNSISTPKYLQEDEFDFHNITQLMYCVHGPRIKFKNKASGCQNSSALH
jgi:hypothetical protein